MRLTEEAIAKAFNEAGSDKQRGHNYAEAYAEIFQDRDEVDNILEVGIANGIDGMTSLTAWNILYPGAMVYGADIVPEKMVVDQKNVKTFICDQSNKAALEFLSNRIPAKLDVLIDDGSHMFEHARLTFEVLWPKVKEDGVFIIEDVSKPGCYYGQFQQTVENWVEYLDANGFQYKVYDTKPGVEDDSIVIRIEKKDNR
jgi:hypothetical protein